MSKMDGCTCRNIIREAEEDAARVRERLAEEAFKPRTLWTPVRIWWAHRTLNAANERARKARLRLMAMVI